MSVVSASRAIPEQQVSGASPERTPLRIGVMLRAIGDHDGAGVYIRALLDALLALDRVNEYVLFYSSDDAGAGATPGFPACASWSYARPASCSGTRCGAGGRLARASGRAVPPQVQHSRRRALSRPSFSSGAPSTGRFPSTIRPWATASTGSTTPLTIPLFCRRAARVLTNSDSLAARAGAAGRRAARRRWPRSTPPPTSASPGSLTRTRSAGCAREYGLPDQPFFLMVVKGYARMDNAEAGAVPAEERGGHPGGVRPGARRGARLPADGHPGRRREGSALAGGAARAATAWIRARS